MLLLVQLRVRPRRRCAAAAAFTSKLALRRMLLLLQLQRRRFLQLPAGLTGACGFGSYRWQN
jgi:hypothetical protein